MERDVLQDVSDHALLNSEMRWVILWDKRAVNTTKYKEDKLQM